MELLKPVKSFLLQYRVLLVLYILITLFSFYQLLIFEHNNNFTIFRQSVFHFLDEKPLYIAYPKEYFDLFYYNPVFPVLFMPFAMLPFKAGMLAWIIVTAIGSFYIFKYMPLSDKQNQFFLLLIMFDIMNNLTHTQTNPFLLSFMVFSWVMLEKDRPFAAALFMTLSFLIKGYGGIIGLLCFYYKSWYKVILYGIFWLVVINALMLLFVPVDVAIQYYKDWLEIISGDTIIESYSVYGLMKNLNLNIPETYILVAAMMVLLPYMVIHFLSEGKREHILAFLLIWVIVFNRASEPATYIIAMGGVILWHITHESSRLSSILFWSTICIATLIPKDVMPLFDDLRYNYYLKTVFCILVMLDMFIHASIQLKQKQKAIG